MTLYANVRKDSRYGSQRQALPFPVTIHPNQFQLIDGFFWKGGIGGQYRTVDLEFFIQDPQSEKFVQVSPLESGEPELISQITEFALKATYRDFMERFIAQLEIALAKSKDHLEVLIQKENAISYEEDE